MALFSVADMAHVVQGQLVGGEPEAPVRTVTHDSREVTPGALFVAIRGQKSDGHSFVDKALSRGAVAALVEEIPPGIGPERGALCLVDNTVTSLGLLGRHYRRRFPVQVWGITGSLGKTTTKEMVASILGPRFRLLKSPGNLNTEVGLPLALFGLTPEHQLAVLEMGARKPGDIEWLCYLAEPHGALITNVAESHVGVFGDVDRVARAKSELVQAAQGPVCLNADDPRVRAMERLAAGRVIMYGSSSESEVTATDVRMDTFMRPTFTLRLAGEAVSVSLPLHGAHQVMNATAAASVAHALEMDVEDIVAGLESVEPVSMRMAVHRIRDLMILDDSYNASPTSAQAALDILKRLPADRRVAILADMLELGDMGPEAHLKLGEAVAACGLNLLITVGDMAGLIYQGALEAGLASERALHYRTVEGLLKDLSALIAPDSTVLVKGSRGMRMERIVEALKAEGG